MKTVKVRIAVVVTPDGTWSSCGWDGGEDAEKFAIACDGLDCSMDNYMERGAESRFWLEAELPVPETTTVQANYLTGCLWPTEDKERDDG